jgi:hypothetical protein
LLEGETERHHINITDNGARMDCGDDFGTWDQRKRTQAHLNQLSLACHPIVKTLSVRPSQLFFPGPAS